MPARLPRIRANDSLWLGYRAGARQRRLVRLAALLTGTLAGFLLLWGTPWNEPVLRLTQGVTLMLTAWVSAVLVPVTGRLRPAQGRLEWDSRCGAPAPGGPCRIVACLPGAVALTLGPQRCYRWVFRDEMTQEHWRRLHLLARFADQDRVRRPG